MATVKCGTFSSLGKVENYQVKPDDRQTKVQVLDGDVVQDMGCFDEGLTFSFSTTFRKNEFDGIYDLWKNRTRFTFVDPAGKEWKNCRLLLKSWMPLEQFEQTAYKVTCEIWTV